MMPSFHNHCPDPLFKIKCWILNVFWTWLWAIVIVPRSEVDVGRLKYQIAFAIIICRHYPIMRNTGVEATGTEIEIMWLPPFSLLKMAASFCKWLYMTAAAAEEAMMRQEVMGIMWVINTMRLSLTLSPHYLKMSFGTTLTFIIKPDFS